MGKTLTKKDVASKIKAWRKDISVMTYGTIGMASMLCSAHNWATCPSEPRTDQEHRACRTFARQIRKQLTLHCQFWYETESGLYRTCSRSSI